MVVQARSTGIVYLFSYYVLGLFLMILGIEAMGELIVAGLVVLEVVEHVLLPDLEVVNEFGEVIAFLHFVDERFADAED